METQPTTVSLTVTPLSPPEPVSLFDRFMSAFNEMDDWMRKSTKLGRDMGFTAVLQEFERKSPLGPDGDFLRSAADLRNVLVHRRTLPFLEMATPTDRVVAQLEMIRDRMLHPPKVYPKYQKSVIVVGPDDSLEQVMRMVSRLEFSQFPVMEGGKFTGLLTENGITRWLAQKIANSISLVDFADAKVCDLVVNEERRENFLFIPRSMSIAEVREKFRGCGLLEAALITENGRRGEKLLGLINRWDLAEE
jgi:predicted transcriptional regulator